MRYPQEVKDFIAANVEGMTTKELAELVNLKFHTSFTESKMKAYKGNHKLKSGTPTARKAGLGSKVFPIEVREYILQNYKGVGPTEMTSRLNQLFGKEYEVRQLTAYYKNHDLNSGLTGCFVKGNIPPNKGKKGYHAPGAEKGWFKKGHLPVNHVPVGTELFKADGYLWVKIAEPNVWRQKHIIMWEEVNGPIPEGHRLTFLDSDKTNVTLENLALVTMAESAVLTHCKLRSTEAELTKTGLLIAKIKITRQEKLKKLRKRGA